MWRGIKIFFQSMLKLLFLWLGMLHFRWIMTQKLKKKKKNLWKSSSQKSFGLKSWNLSGSIFKYDSSLFKLWYKGVWSVHNESYNFCIEINRKTSWKIYFSKHLAQKVETLRKNKLRYCRLMFILIIIPRVGRSYMYSWGFLL